MPIAAHTCILKYGAGSYFATGSGTTLITGTTYRVTIAANRVIDPSVAVVVKDGGTPIATSGFTVDYLKGEVTLTSPPAGVVTMDFKNLSMQPALEAKEFSISLVRDELETTVFQDTVKTYILGLKGGGGTIGSLDVLSTNFLNLLGQTESIETVWDGDKRMVMEIALSPTTTRIFRAFVKVPSLDLSGARDGLIEGSFPFTIDEVTTPQSATGKTSFTFLTY
jgi:hypothetical protein